MPQVRCTVFIATSLDGFIARENGDIDWLPHGADADGEDYGFAAFMKTVDALVMGRKTYETVRTLGAWPYGRTPVIVLATRKVEIPRELSKTVTTMSGKVDAIISHLAANEMKHLYVDGGITIQRFLNAGAIQRIIITRIPVLIGKGIPLFGPVERDITLRHVATQHYPSGLVQSEYEVAPARRRTTTAKARISRRVSKPRVSKARKRL